MKRLFSMCTILFVIGCTPKEKHIADVFTDKRLVVEFQHSHIDPAERRKEPERDGTRQVAKPRGTKPDWVTNEAGA